MMRWLKSLVIILGVLIAGGLVLLGYGFFKTAQDPNWRLAQLFRAEPDRTPSERAETAGAPPPAATAPRAFGKVQLALPIGCSVTDIDPDGRRAFLTIGPPGPCHRVIVIDVDAGRVLGTIEVSR